MAIISSAEQIWRNLPAFLRRKGYTGMPWLLCQGLGAAMDLLSTEVRLLRVRGIAARVSGTEYITYYGSDERQEDMARLGAARGLTKLNAESWEEFETRLVAFMGSEEWTTHPERGRFTVTGDVAEWGCYSGLERELERTGLVVSEMYAAKEEEARWRILTRATMGGERDINFSEITDRGTEHPAGQRWTKIYSRGGAMWIVYIVLTDPDEVDYQEDEVRRIVRAVKPAWVRVYVKFPDATVWEKVD